MNRLTHIDPTSRPTALQVVLSGYQAVLTQARTTLDDRGWHAWLDILATSVARETARTLTTKGHL